MWRNPKYFPDAPAADQQQAPEPTGRLLASFPRRSHGVDQELRIVIDEFEGHEYVSVRLWERGRDGAWWPTRKGVSIRMGELAGVAEALTTAAQSPTPATGRPLRPDWRSTPKPPRVEGPPSDDPGY